MALAKRGAACGTADPTPAASASEGMEAATAVPPATRAPASAALRFSSPAGPAEKIILDTVPPRAAAPVGGGAFGEMFLPTRYLSPEGKTL